MVEILCFDFEWQYIKSEFLADHKHAEFGTRDFKGKICKETYSWFLKICPNGWRKLIKSLFRWKNDFFSHRWKNDFFFTLKSHKIACELTGQNPCPI